MGKLNSNFLFLPMMSWFVLGFMYQGSTTYKIHVLWPSSHTQKNSRITKVAVMFVRLWFYIKLIPIHQILIWRTPQSYNKWKRLLWYYLGIVDSYKWEVCKKQSNWAIRVEHWCSTNRVKLFVLNNNIQSLSSLVFTFSKGRGKIITCELPIAREVKN